VEEVFVPLGEDPVEAPAVAGALVAPASPFPVAEGVGFVSVVPDFSSALGLPSPTSVEEGGFSLSE